ncbi:MAG: glycosyltransferase family 39 protein [Pseudomonadota bacterium]
MTPSSSISPARLRDRLWRLCRAHPTLVVAIFALAVALPGTASLPPLDRDESRFAQATAQMLETGDFVRIQFQDAERNKKPAGIHWLQAASVAAVSSAEAREIWAYRLPSIAGAVATAAATCWIGALLFGTPTGLLAGLFMAASLGLIGEATIAKTDAVLAALIAVAQGALAKLYLTATGRTDDQGAAAWAWLFWGATGLSVLVKGPIGPAISALTILGVFFADRSLRLVRSLRPLRGLALLVAISGPWAIAIGLATEGRFFVEAVGGDMLGKVAEGQESHGAPPGYYLALVWATFWPASLALIPAALLVWREQTDPRLRFCVAWALPAWIMFEAASTKLPHYVLPLYPALAILCARAILTAQERGGPVWPWRVNTLFWLLIALTLAGLCVAGPELYRSAGAQPLDIAVAGVIAAGSAFITWRVWAGRILSAATLSVALSAAISVWLLEASLPSLDRLRVSEQVATAMADQSPVALTGYYEPSAVFLLGTETELTTAEGAAQHLSPAAGGNQGAAVEKRQEAAFLAEARRLGLNLQRTGRVSGLNYSNGDEVTLSLYKLRGSPGAAPPAKEQRP